MIGNRYTRLVVKEKASQKASWLCVCDCGTEKVVRKQALETGHVKSCGCLKRDNLEVGRRKMGHNNPNYKGTKDIPQSVVVVFKRGALARGLEWNVSIEDLQQLWTGYCSLTGDVIHFNGTSKNWTASIDRIDSSKGYTIDNVQFVLKYINMMKYTLSQVEFIEMCKKVALYNK